MNSAGQEMARFMKPNFFQQLAQKRAEMEHHPVVRQLRMEFPGESVDINRLYQLAKEADGCGSCPGLFKCPNEMPGHQLIAIADPLGQGKPAFTHRVCARQIAQDKQEIARRRVRSHYIPDNIMRMTFTQLEKDGPRLGAIKEAMQFCINYKPGQTKRGLYLTGGFGVGKSSIFGAVAQELGERNVDVLMVYVPDFLSEVKHAIRTGEVESKIDVLREVSVLILDDLGAEPLTAWTRDEVLGPILQRRMERLPTLISSNLTLTELRTHLSQAKDEKEPNHTKGARLMERIEPFVKAVHVGGRNRRRD